jgi:hypothetical protein
MQKKYKNLALSLLRVPTQEQRQKLLWLLVRQFGVNKETYCLDIGGISEGFEELGKVCNAISINLELRKKIKGWNIITGDARQLPIKDKSIDLAYSVALLEHVHLGREEVASEINRVVQKGYLIAVPYYFSPLEPHYLVPFFQFVPESIKRILILKIGLRIGHINKNNYEVISLFKPFELALLFPEATVRLLKVFSIPISVTALKTRRQ